MTYPYDIARKYLSEGVIDSKEFVELIANGADERPVSSLLARAQYALERGWTAAAMDALGRARRLLDIDKSLEAA